MTPTHVLYYPLVSGHGKVYGGAQRRYIGCLSSSSACVFQGERRRNVLPHARRSRGPRASRTSWLQVNYLDALLI
jgi:hypothetical protein